MLRILVVERFCKKFHQAVVFIDVSLNFLPFDIALLRQAPNMLMVHTVIYGGPVPQRTVFYHRGRIVH